MPAPCIIGAVLPRPIAIAAAAALLLGAPTGAAAATRTTTSSNWSGYAVSRSGVAYKRVSGTWVQPKATCNAGERRYSAYWVGLGGLHTTSAALEQVGTEADCAANGTAVYSTWYELVPSAPASARLTVRPGDTISASVTVTGHTVKLFLADRTRGTVFSKQLAVSKVDVSSAEWIVEAPSSCFSGGCRTLPLANFGTATFAGARATSMTGRLGTIADPTWSALEIALSPDAAGGRRFRFSPDTARAAAAPADLAATGDAFTVTYQDTTGDVPSSGPVGPGA